MTDVILRNILLTFLWLILFKIFLYFLQFIHQGQNTQLVAQDKHLDYLYCLGLWQEVDFAHWVKHQRPDLTKHRLIGFYVVQDLTRNLTDLTVKLGQDIKDFLLVLLLFDIKFLQIILNAL